MPPSEFRQREPKCPCKANNQETLQTVDLLQGQSFHWFAHSSLQKVCDDGILLRVARLLANSECLQLMCVGRRGIAGRCNGQC